LDLKVFDLKVEATLLRDAARVAWRKGWGV